MCKKKGRINKRSQPLDRLDLSYLLKSWDVYIKGVMAYCWLSNYTKRKKWVRPHVPLLQRNQSVASSLQPKRIKILCDIHACAVIYSPFNSIPEIWPPNSEVHKVIEKFEILTEEEQTEASVNHEEFLTQTITKDEKVKRLTEDNNDKFMKELMYACLNGNLGDLAMDDSMAGHEILGVYSYPVTNVSLSIPQDRHSARGNLCEFIDDYLKKLYHHRNVTLNNPHAS
ncbi:hypothetical protein YC2023_049124 [Brassica napus]